MSDINLTDVNYVVVLIAAALSFGFGFIYFSERFAGSTFMQIHRTKQDAPMAMPLLLEGVNLLLLSWLIAVFFMLQMNHGLVRGIGLLFAVTIIVGHFAAAGFTQKPTKLAVMNSGYFIGVIMVNVATQYVSRMI